MEAEPISWLHRSMASALNFPTFDPSSLQQTQSPADMDVSWLFNCSCSGYAFSCKNQCHPFCNCKSKSFCTSSASSCTCDSKTSEISSYVNRSDLFKCCCFQQLSQYATAEPFGKLWFKRVQAILCGILIHHQMWWMSVSAFIADGVITAAPAGGRGGELGEGRGWGGVVLKGGYREVIEKL